jgi:flagellar protein FlgJ
MMDTSQQALQSASASASHYHDASALSALKHVAKDNPEQAAKEVATQFEAMFIQMMLKSMRDAVPEGGLFNSNDMKTYTEMADQQIAVNLAKSGGIGLAEVITRQLTMARSGSEMLGASESAAGVDGLGAVRPADAALSAGPIVKEQGN